MEKMCLAKYDNHKVYADNFITFAYEKEVDVKMRKALAKLRVLEATRKRSERSGWDTLNYFVFPGNYLFYGNYSMDIKAYIFPLVQFRTFEVDLDFFKSMLASSWKHYKLRNFILSDTSLSDSFKLIFFSVVFISTYIFLWSLLYGFYLKNIFISYFIDIV